MFVFVRGDAPSAGGWRRRAQCFHARLSSRIAGAAGCAAFRLGRSGFAAVLSLSPPLSLLLSMPLMVLPWLLTLLLMVLMLTVVVLRPWPAVVVVVTVSRLATEQRPPAQPSQSIHTALTCGLALCVVYCRRGN